MSRGPRGRGVRGGGRGRGGGGGGGRGRGRSFNADGLFGGGAGGFRGRSSSAGRGGGRRGGGRAPSAHGREQGAPPRRAAPAAATSRGEGSDSDDDAPLQLGDGSAYDALLTSLSRSGGAAAAALERRRRQQAGDSESSSGDDDGDDMSADEEADEEASGEEGLSGEDGSGAEEEAEEPDGASGGDSSDSDDVAAVEGVEHVQPPSDIAAAADEAEPSGDSFSARLETLLSDADVAALRARLAAKAAWKEAGPAPGAAPDAVWELDPPAELPAARPSPADYPLPAGLLRRWALVAGGAGREDASGAAAAQPASSAAQPQPRWASEGQSSLFALLDSYRDVAYTARALPPPPPEPDGTPGDGGSAASDEVMDACLLHALSHLLKTRARVLHNTDKLRKRAAAAHAAAKAAAEAAGARPPRLAPVVDDVPQDQGFARPKLLLLVPMRSFAKRWLDRALQLLPAAQGAADAVSKRERYEREYGPRPDEAGPAPRALRGKPPDYRALFAGNRDDHFRLGAKLTRKSVRLYADFAGADLIVASPLGLATRLEAGDTAFLSSVELVIADGCDVMAMQNWAHVAAVFGALNAMPVGEVPGCEIMRVRPWYLNGLGAHYRQSVLLSAHGTPQLAALARESCANAAGRARLRAPQPGVLRRVVARATAEFSRVLAPRAADAPDARFAAFTAKLWPRLRESRGGDLLFVPSYFDFVRLRNFLKANDASFVANGEYADPSEVGRARAAFSAGDARIMLYSERAHYFRRHCIRGARRLVCYGPPETAGFYAELVNGLEAGPEPNDVALLFSRWDGPALERLVGTPRAQRMLRDAAPAYVFC